MSEQNEDIEWEIFSLEEMKNEGLWDLGYIGGVQIGRKKIYLLRHLKTKGEEVLSVQVPRFMIFDVDADPTLRENGNPMSRSEFRNLLDFHFQEKVSVDIEQSIFEQVKKSYLETSQPLLSSEEIDLKLVKPVDGLTAMEEAVETTLKEDPLHVFAFLLYTQANTHLYDFVKKHHDILSSLTGPHFTMFVIWNVLAKDQEADQEELAKVSYKFGAYTLAREFGIELRKVPCLVFFRDLDEIEVVVCSLDDSWKQSKLIDVLEHLTDDVEKARKKAEGQKEKLWKSLEGTIKKREWFKKLVEKIKLVKPILEIIKTLIGFLPSSDD
ncbi:MAG: hypothetical protein ACFFFC_13030 [Candidatus Thorarchaeota archaeon]